MTYDMWIFIALICGFFVFAGLFVLFLERAQRKARAMLKAAQEPQS